VLGGIASVLLAGACFALLDTIAKYVTMSVPVLGGWHRRHPPWRR
jgi:hypothetical protein